MPGDNISVERATKSPFTKAVKNIRGLIKKGQVKVQDQDQDVTANHAKKDSTPISNSKVFKKRVKSSGTIVYLSHLPDGFEEKGIRAYLEQFGKVTHVRLVRSKRTGRSRGFAFVRFEEHEVAEIVVKTMNNYLMYKRLVKAELATPVEDGGKVCRIFDSAPIKPENCKTAISRKAYLRKRDKFRNNKAEQRLSDHSKRSVRRLQKKLVARGISYDMKFTKKGFMPGGVSENSVATSEKEDESLILVQDISDPEIDFAIPDGVPVTPWTKNAA